VCSGANGLAVTPLAITLDNFLEVQPGQLRRVDPAWRFMRRGRAVADLGGVLALGSAADGDDMLYHLPVALYDGCSSPCNR
jgi:hypothetical protein